MRKLLFAMLATTAIQAAAAASPIASLFNTGTDDMGTVQADGSAESHFTLAVAPSGSSGLHVQTTGYPVGVWTAAPDDAAWITPDDAAGVAPFGRYDYRLTFDLTGYDASNASIAGQYAADDAGVEIDINGQAFQATSSDLHSLTPFAVNGGFVAGLNTLDFIVQNTGSSLPAAPSPSGLLVELTGDAPLSFGGGAPVPEPGSMALLASAAVGLGFMSRRRPN